jgi:hypothetical protein
MNDEYASRSRAVAGNIQEVDVVLSKRHDGVIAAGVRGFLNGIPANSRCVGALQVAHVEIVHLAVREGVWRTDQMKQGVCATGSHTEDICVVV